MPGYYTESYRYLEIAEETCKDLADIKKAFVCIMFSAMYIEAVINDLIFSEKLNEKLLAKYKNESSKDYYDFDLYHDKISFDSKLNVIFEKYSLSEYENHKEYIELKHLISIRNSLAHLKPLEQNKEGCAETKISRKALNYLYKNLNLIPNPLGIGMFWANAIKNKKVAEWSIIVAKNSVKYLYDATYTPPFGNSLLHYHISNINRK